MTYQLKRYALISSDDDAIGRSYLPDNYSVAGKLDWEGRPVTVIEGRDHAGWTLDAYVLPRLASGLYFGQEISLDHPIFKQL